MFAEKIEMRLCDINLVPLPDALHLYTAMLKGFNSLYSRVGFFHIREDMVGFSKNGQAKVWIHSKFYKDRPEHPDASLQKNQY